MDVFFQPVICELLVSYLQQFISLPIFCRTVNRSPERLVCRNLLSSHFAVSVIMGNEGISKLRKCKLQNVFVLLHVCWSNLNQVYLSRNLTLFSGLTLWEMCSEFQLQSHKKSFSCSLAIVYILHAPLLHQLRGGWPLLSFLPCCVCSTAQKDFINQKQTKWVFFLLTKFWPFFNP